MTTDTIDVAHSVATTAAGSGLGQMPIGMANKGYRVFGTARKLWRGPGWTRLAPLGRDRTWLV
jgi:hypothetical protein